MAIVSNPKRIAMAFSMLVMPALVTGCSDRDAILSEKIAAADAAARRAEAAAERAESAAKRVASGGSVAEAPEPAEPEIDTTQDTTADAETGSDSSSGDAG